MHVILIIILLYISFNILVGMVDRFIGRCIRRGASWEFFKKKFFRG